MLAVPGSRLRNSSNSCLKGSPCPGPRWSERGTPVASQVLARPGRRAATIWPWQHPWPLPCWRSGGLCGLYGLPVQPSRPRFSRHCSPVERSIQPHLRQPSCRLQRSRCRRPESCTGPELVTSSRSTGPGLLPPQGALEQHTVLTSYYVTT